MDTDMTKENKGKKFDICLMNPPYNRSLHLKFLEKAIQVCENVVSIQPCEFIVRPYIKKLWEIMKNKYKSTIGNYIKELDVIKKQDAPKYFDAGIDIDLGIYICTQSGGLDYDNFYKNFDKGFQYNLQKFKTQYSIRDKLEKYTNQKYFVPIRKDGNIERWWCLQLTNYLDIIENRKIYSGLYKGLTIPEAREKNPRENPRNTNRDTVGLSFNTLSEAINFRDMTKLEAFIYIIAMLKTTRSNPLDKIPYLNPTIKWTNDKIFDFFNIDNDIREDIIRLVKPFMKSTKNFGNMFDTIKDQLLEL